MGAFERISPGSDPEIYHALFEHPASLDLSRHDVRAMLDAFAESSHGRDGSTTYARNGETLFLAGGRGGHAFDADELWAIRQFLQRAGSRAKGVVAAGAHLMVVIDDLAARVYEIVLRGAEPCALEPYDPHGFAGHLRYVLDGDFNARRRPECRTFYEAVAKTLRGADRVVLVFGSAPGARGAVNELFAELRLSHGDLERRILGTLAVDWPTPSETCLLDAARKFYRRRQN